MINTDMLKCPTNAINPPWGPRALSVCKSKGYMHALGDFWIKRMMRGGGLVTGVSGFRCVTAVTWWAYGVTCLMSWWS